MKSDLKPCRLKKTNKNNISSSLPLTHLVVIYKPQIELLWGVRVCLCMWWPAFTRRVKWGVGRGVLISPLWTGWSNMMSSLRCSVISLPSGGAIQLHGQRQRAVPQRGVPLLPTGSSGQLHSGQPPHRHWWDKMIHIWMFMWMNWPNGMAHSLSDYWKKAV